MTATQIDESIKMCDENIENFNKMIAMFTRALENTVKQRQLLTIAKQKNESK